MPLYRVSSLKNLRIIIAHFDKYTLLTKKLADYLLFKQSVDLIENKAHLTIEGLLKLVSIKASLNWGLSSLRDPADSNVVKQRGDKFKESFPSIVTVAARPEIKFTGIQDINWLVGFVEGEGCFMVNILQDRNKTKYYLSLNFSISQHDRDSNLFNGLIKYLNCGRCTYGRNEVNFIISKFGYLNNKIIPIFNQYPMLGTKQADFLDFCKIAKLVENKEHLRFATPQHRTEWCCVGTKVLKE
uniref:LAGLIDADG endonuclease n=1 Tax=Juglanconis sp. TaxID=2041886 RepID=A0A291LJA1_9PEZI|nr:LAGLIDADG endonuclease [Juglanconis sp.]